MLSGSSFCTLPPLCLRCISEHSCEALYRRETEATPIPGSRAASASRWGLLGPEAWGWRGEGTRREGKGTLEARPMDVRTVCPPGELGCGELHSGNMKSG